MTLTRDLIKNGGLRRMIAAGDQSVPPLTDDELQASRDRTLARRRAGAACWLFGYGSLIWNPTIQAAESRIGTARGWHRRFCLWTSLGRGSPERPGLMLGLERGGSCRGVVFRIADDIVDAELDLLWRREMVTGAYAPRWVSVATEAGPVDAIAFTINRDHPRYAGKLPDDQVAAAIAQAAGFLGPCAEYLDRTVAHLAELGIADHRLTRLANLVASKRTNGA